MTWTVLITESAARQLRRLRKRLGKAGMAQVEAQILALSEDPRQKSQPLTGPLAAFRSVHSGRVRIIIRIVDQTVRLYVVAAGWHESGSRDDIYQILTRAIESGVIDPDSLR